MKLGLEDILFGILNLANKFQVQLLLDDCMDAFWEIMGAFIAAVAPNEVPLEAHSNGYEPLPQG